MKTYRTLLSSAVVALSVLAAVPTRADNMASISIAPATGAVTLVPRWGIGGGLAGFHHMAQDLGLTGSVANSFYSIRNGAIPAGGDILAFNFYVAGSGSATPHADIGSKLTPNSYSALTSADPDVGFGSVNFYLIHHKGTTDFFTAIIPGSATSSAVTDLKPMSGPGGPGTVTGVSGYFGLTFAAANLGFGLNNFYYLRTDPVTGSTKFGTLEPALLASSADQFDLGGGGHNALAFTGTDVGFGTNQMYYLRLDPITGFTIFGTLNPALAGARHTSDIANLGSVFSALTFVPGDVGFGSAQFYTAGPVNTTWQSVSFVAIADRTIGAGSFTVTPSASSGLPIALTVVSGSTGAAAISSPVAGVFTVTPTAPGVITLQATQAGQAGTVEFNMLRQTFAATGVALLSITSQPTPQTAVIGATASFSVTASSTSAVSYQWRKAGANITANASALTATLALPNVQSAAAGSYDVVVTNASGSLISDAALLTVTSPAPIITNTPLTAAGTIGTAFSFTITASGSPTSFTATPLPAGLALNAATGVITGSPTATGTTAVLLGATNATGTGNATLSITVAAAGVAPIITNSPLTAAGTVGTAFSFSITASGSPTSFTASPLPAGLALNAATGVITGSPTAIATTAVLLGATNTTGTGNATLTITVAAAGVAPIITNSPLTAAGTVGTAFSFSITASGTPTSFTATPLPAGLVLNATTGVITGSPTATGTTAVLLGATNGIGTGNATLSVTVAAAGVAPIITNSPLTAAGTVGTPFSFAITASGTPTSFTASPLPAGLSLVAATGIITGSPTATGTTAVLLGATNATGTGNATLSITVAAAGVAPIITNSPLTAAGTVGTPFSFAITATGTPTSFAASPLPAGLSLVAATGVITGSPTATGTTAVLLGATNATGTDTATLTITVAAAGTAPIITNSPLTAAGTVGAPFSFALTASGTPTSFTASPLPAGLSLVAATGAITGTPTTTGATTVLLGATNATGTGTATLTITVAAASVAPIITSPTSAPGTVGTPFVTYFIVATGLPTGFSAAGLPAGLTLNALTGAINGTPTSVGISAVTLNATNATGTGSVILTITVASAATPPIITSATSAAGTVGTPFVTYFILATGTPTGFSATGLPEGLALNAVTGAINGTPESAGTSVVTLNATNSLGTGSTTLTLTIAPEAVSPIITSPTVATGTVGVPLVTFQVAGTDNPVSFTASGLPAGLTLNALTGRINGVPTTAGSAVAEIGAVNANGVRGSRFLTFVIAPAITTAPANTTATLGAGATFTVGANVGGGTAPTYQWRKDGVEIPGAVNATLTLPNAQPGDVAFYTVVVTSGGSSTTTTPALLTLNFTGKLAGAGTEVNTNVKHPNGNTYDQVLLTGTAVSVHADAGQITRVSYIDLTDDIVQVEFSGAGTLTLNLELSSGPAAPLNYNQPGVLYMKGHAAITVTGADDTTNVSIYGVGPFTAVDQTLFLAGTELDGWADIALVAVTSATGRLGGIRTANASYFRSHGMTGVYAPGVALSGPLFVSDLSGFGPAKAVLVLGSVADLRITGGSLLQDNGAGVAVSGMTRVRFAAGTSSGGVLVPAQANRARLLRNGVDVTAELVPPN